MKLSSVLNTERGVIALIGGGGKTTAMYKLTEELRSKGTVILCTSTHIRVPEQYPLVTGEADELRAALAAHGAVCAGSYADHGKLTAPKQSFEELADMADYIIVEADGSRGLPMKAHDPHEPVIPENTGLAVLVVGADGFGRPVKEVCHRPGLYAELAGISEDTPVSPADEAKIIISEGFGDVVLVNKAENAYAQSASEELARLLSCPVIAGSLHQEVYICL